MPEDIVRVIRVLEYTGKRSQVEQTLERNTVKGVYQVRDLTIREASLGLFPEIIEPATEDRRPQAVYLLVEDYRPDGVWPLGIYTTLEQAQAQRPGLTWKLTSDDGWDAEGTVYTIMVMTLDAVAEKDIY